MSSPGAPVGPEDVLAVVPVKDLGGTKSRLAPVLDPAARAGLTIYMMRRVVKAAYEAGVGAVCVVSPDVIVLSEAEKVGAAPLLQRSAGLNAALAEGRECAVRRGAGAMFILPADLPLVEPEDLVGLLREAREGVAVVSPDAGRDGTNALLVAPPGALERFHFGVGSFEAHRRAAARAGLEVREHPNARLAFDLDTGTDLLRLREGEPGGEEPRPS
ncbi:2-phospho-L-lactate guanylyltransferase [Rubrobacter radiotolerans]|uniref:Phosphoenolpyruvate guanylyltransferase n=1 Tax=Rubrobacter radiotolerans TaxID=42256 RepID=A0A023X116_RUBRA|nr:2-phospho-L-lactate guanylyltransferase [Rubrobacter radiotolerans]AHY46152.1 2-phospho-L-lactate guanylyltransferase [Rubrobacter radiotolerans]MDX5893562.1 2-phospho-L-lactate guanylyltransferase [Rubrobacter radiotolerans]SMC03991.1 2-phospho-L-lactate guanylyltransferase [Rubrobacter radiotolerans DSM 5868]